MRASEITAEMISRAARPDADAPTREAIVLAMMPRVRRVVRAQRVTASLREEAEQAGVIGVLRAIDAFDSTRGGAAFPTYAHTWIVGEVNMAITRSRSGPTLSRRHRVRGAKADRAADDATAELGREPSPAELARTLGYDPRRYARPSAAVEAGRLLHPSNLPAPDADPADVATERLRLMEVLALLEHRERAVFALVVGLLDDVPPITYREAAIVLGLSYGTTFRSYQSAVAKIIDAVASGALPWLDVGSDQGQVAHNDAGGSHAPED